MAFAAIQSSAAGWLSKKQAYWISFFLIILIGVALRLQGVIDQPITLQTDFLNHYRAALAILEGEFPSYLVYKGPVYAPWLAIGFLLLGGTDYIHWLIWNSVVLYPITTLSLLLLSRECIGKNYFSLVPAILLAILPSAVHIVRLTASENVVLMAVCLATYGYLRALTSERLSVAALGGGLLGFSILVKSILALATPWMGLAFIFRLQAKFPFFRLSLGRGGRNLVRGGMYALVAMAVVAPWSYYASQSSGKFILSASYSDLVLLAANNPFGDERWYFGTRKAKLLIPNYQNSRNFGQYADYGLWYLRHDPKSIIRDSRHNFNAQFGYTGEIPRIWIYRLAQDGPIPYTDKRLLFEKFVFFGILGLGIAGFISRGGATSRAAAITLRSLVVYGMILLPFILILGDERHRMAFMPLMMVLAGTYFRSAYQIGFVKGLVVAPLRGLRAAWSAPTFVISEIWLAVWPRAGVLAGIAAAVGLIWVWWFRDDSIQLNADDFIGGTVSAIHEGMLGKPNPVIGWPQPYTSAESPYEAEFIISAEGGEYQASAVYSSAVPLALDMYVNERLVASGLFDSTTGGSPNRFAVQVPLDSITLDDGLNRISLRQSVQQPRLSGRKEMTLPVPVPKLGSYPETVHVQQINGRESYYEFLLSGMDSINHLSAATDIIPLAQPLEGGAHYSFYVPFSSKGNVEVKMWLLTYDSSGNRMDEAFRRGLWDQFPAHDFKPKSDIESLSVRLTIAGDGWFEIGRTVYVYKGQAVAGREYIGPYIERIDLDPVDKE